ncbi:hypothetical protein BU16DRAFT_529235 [Lophium mytilinum]|uniref:Uncharacterized protein n=1 Tax=Lophium mytilinum TaxID=390894 RepID=A0A6A6QMN0_9PEZI|nr:hypothetical protein BU16DRAFT_529235 [Lophium mytilinum]
MKEEIMGILDDSPWPVAHARSMARPFINLHIPWTPVAKHHLNSLGLRIKHRALPSTALHHFEPRGCVLLIASAAAWTLSLTDPREIRKIIFGL